MRYAIISDIHGNYAALEAVLEDAKGQKIDKYLFLGDYYRDFERPNEVIRLMQSVPDALVLAGNAEGYLKEFDKQDQRKWTDGQLEALYWNYRNLTPDSRKYLDRLPEKFSFVDSGVTVIATHSSKKFLGRIEFDYMDSDSDFLDQHFAQKVFNRKSMLSHYEHILQTDGVAVKQLSSLRDGVYLFGHTHVQWHGYADGKLFINCGACGLPLDLEPGAPYTILTIENGECAVEERRISYDIEEAIRQLYASSFYREAPVWCELNVMQIRSARGYGMQFLKFMRGFAGVTGRLYSKEAWADGFRAFRE